MQTKRPKSLRYNYLWSRRWGAFRYIRIPLWAEVIAGCFSIVSRPGNFQQRSLVLFVPRGKQLRLIRGRPAGGGGGPTLPWARAGCALPTWSHCHIGAMSHIVWAQRVRARKQVTVLRHHVTQQYAFVFVLQSRTFPPAKRDSVNADIVLVTHHVVVRSCFTHNLNFRVVTPCNLINWYLSMRETQRLILRAEATG
jgi:hypothetical protein